LGALQARVEARSRHLFAAERTEVPNQRTYKVTGDRITLRAVSDPGEVWNFAWKLSPDRRTLTFKKQGPIGPTGFIVKPWRRVG
jgi:hypothetical protein